tara:strand:- start:2991 stop:3632 length:642 start_codon:yes stop_codon:yes gene_type:complete
MKNVIESLGTISARHQDDYKPSGFEHAFKDAHNTKKAHHIIVNSDGEIFYNQAIQHDSGWQDFYEWELVEDSRHGYQVFINAAVEATLETLRARREERRNEAYSLPLHIEDEMVLHSNQGDRSAIIVGAIDNQVLVVYRIPKGRYFIRVLEHDVTLADRKANVRYFDGIEHSCVVGRRYRDLRGYPRSKIINKWCQGDETDMIDDVINYDSLG